jgi:hypothetical protein
MSPIEFHAIGKNFLHYSPYNIQMDNIIYSDGYNIIHKL